MGDLLNCTVRGAMEGDLPYIYETLAHHGMRDRWPRPRLAERKQSVESLVAREEVTTLMAVLQDDEDALLGFAVLEEAGPSLPPFVHYVYVRKAARRQGVARRLLSSLEGRVEVAALPDFALPPRFVLNVNRSVL